MTHQVYLGEENGVDLTVVFNGPREDWTENIQCSSFKLIYVVKALEETKQFGYEI